MGQKDGLFTVPGSIEQAFTSQREQTGPFIVFIEFPPGKFLVIN
jgi:hypothetical protein